MALLSGVSPPVHADSPDGGGGQPGAWAVIIGIDHYANGENLQSARADASDMDQVLANDGIPASHRLVLSDSQATGAAIRNAATWLANQSTDGTTAVFFYAGHVDKLSSRTEALRGSDLDLVTDAQLAARFSHLHARAAWFTIAGCYGGGFQELLGPGRMLTAASDANSLSYENESFGRSYLDQYMIRQGLLQGAADSSVQAAFAYASAELRRDYPNRVPLEWDDVGSPVDLRSPASPPSTPTPAPAPPPAAEPPPTSSTLVKPAVGERVAPAAPPARPTLLRPTAAPAPPTAVPTAVQAPPIATITRAIDELVTLQQRLASWLSGSSGAR